MKPNHDYKCDECGKPATVNAQETTIFYDIDNDGEFSEYDQSASGDNQFFCDKHQ